MNPIFWREARVRPRSRLAPLWLPAASVPAGLILLGYLWNARGMEEVTLSARAAFEFLAALQTLAWLTLGATLTAGTVAAEREQGLLESLQLSGMTPLSILAGKLTASLAFAVLIVAASLPIWVLAMFLGAVPPDLALRVAVLHGATALLGASVGLAWSAWTRRAAAALRVSLICLAIWGVGSALAGIVARNNGPQGAAWAAWIVAALRLAGATNPLAAAFSIHDNLPAVSLLLMASPSRTLVLFDALAATPPFIVSTVFQLTVAPFLLWLAARGIAASFDAPPKPKAARIRRALGRALPARRIAAPPPRVGPPFYDIPFITRLRFANPVLAREIKGKFRQPRVPRWVVVVQSALGVAVLGFYLLVMWWAISRPATCAQTWWVIAFTGLGVVMTAAPMMGAANFSRERERGTWEGMLLTPLTARAIMNGKIGSALLAIAAFSLPLLPLLSLCVGRPGGVSWLQAALTFVLIGGTAYSFSAFGTAVSWKAERTAPVGGGMLLLVAAQCVLPFLASRPGWQWLIALNPPSSLTVLAGAVRAMGLRSEGPFPHQLYALICAINLILIGLLCEWYVRRALRKQGHP